MSESVTPRFALISGPLNFDTIQDVIIRHVEWGHSVRRKVSSVLDIAGPVSELLLSRPSKKAHDRVGC
jgi:hypothetical protein